MMTADQRTMIFGLYINSALYLAGCMVFGWLTGHTWSWRAALACAAVCYFSYMVMAQPPAPNERSNWRELLSVVLGVLSIALGAFAGLSLLF